MNWTMLASIKWMSLFTICISLAQLASALKGQTTTVQFETTNFRVNENGGSVELVLIADQTHYKDQIVGLRVTDVTTNPNDYNITSPLDVVIPGGSNKTILVVGIVDDNVYEQTLENFAINLTSSNPEATIGAKSRAEIAIIDDDVYTLSFESFPTRVVESVGEVVVGFQVQVPAGGTEISEEFEIFFDILLENADYPDDFGIPEAITETTVSISITDDDLLEDTESFYILLQATGIRFSAPDRQRIDIIDNDVHNVYFESTVYNVSESNGLALISLIADGISQFPYFVCLEVNSKTANGTDNILLGNPLSVMFRPGSRKGILPIIINNDDIYEGTQSFTLTISSTGHQRILFQSENRTTVNIIDDEVVFVEFNKSDYTAMESDGRIVIGLNVILPPGGSTVLVDFIVTMTTIDITARDNNDYVLETQQLQLGTSMLTSEVVIQVIDDDVVEADEEFMLMISEITPDGMISSNSFSVNLKIIDDDARITVKMICPLDIIFVIDDSSSISGNQFKRLKNFLTKMVDSLDIREDRVRVGVIKYAKGVKDEIRLDDFTTKASLKRAIRKIKHERGGTRTGRAISRMVKAFQGGFGGRSDTDKIGIVITDGKSKDSVARPVRRAQGNGITLYGIGIGRSIDRNEIRSITGGDTSHTFFFTRFTILNRVTRELTAALSC